MLKVLVTGNLGYIGPFMVAFLKNNGYYTIGCDVDLFKDSQLEEFERPHIQLTKDFRDLSLSELNDIYCIIHLAAISNDPMGDFDSALTYSINYHGVCELAIKAKEAGVKRFLYSSSCSIYGKSGDHSLTEEDALNPLTAYADSKIKSEKFLQTISDDKFITTYLRNSTAFGYSPVFRIDLVVNNLLACAVSKGKIIIKSDGEPWRPFLHCSDIAKAFLCFLTCPSEIINGEAFNIGVEEQNYQVKDIARMVKELLPDAEIVFTGEVGEDPRNYKVNFNKFKSAFPEYRPDYDLKSGMKELFIKLNQFHFSESDFDGVKFTRLKLLKLNINLLRH